MATQERDLREGRSVWQGRRGPIVPHAALARNISTDVLVVGAGITGAVIADELAAGGMTVAVVDKRGLARGSTMASTALVQYEIDTPLIRLASRIGKKNAVRAWRRSRLAVNALSARLGELQVADVARRNSLYLAGDMLDPEELAAEHAARRSAGLPSRYLRRKELRDQFGIRRAAALMGYGNLVIDPRKSALAFLKAAVGNGARVYAPAEIMSVTPRRDGVTAVAANGCAIHCRKLVFATGYEVPDGVPCNQHKITSTWAIATAIQKRRRLWPGECCIWEASDPYLYVRTTTEGRVVCGGEDAEFSDERRRNALIPAKTGSLQRKLGRLFPEIDPEAEYAWAGTFGETTTGLPIIGIIPGMPNCWAALGDGGNGTSYAMIAADVIVAAIVGRQDADADLYAFHVRKRRKH